MGAFTRRLPDPLKNRLASLAARLALARAAMATLRRSSADFPPGTLDGVVARNPFGLYLVPRATHHRPAAQAILWSRVWEAATIRAITAVDAGADVVHAGTFFGDFLPALARSRQGDAVVWAFEPSRQNHRAAQATCILNDLGNVVLTHAALGARIGRAKLATASPGGVALGGSSHLVEAGSPAQRLEDVTVTTIDDSVPEDRRVAVIHLDVEGHEEQALTGALATIERCRPCLVLETMPTSAWVDTHLAPLGYQRRAVVDGNTVLAPTEVAVRD